MTLPLLAALLLAAQGAWAEPLSAPFAGALELVSAPEKAADAVPRIEGIELEPAFARRLPPGVCEEAASLLQDGDLLFMDSHNAVFERVAEASNSWASHVGVAYREGGRWRLYESKLLSGAKTDLCKFLGRSNGRYALGRLKRPLDPARAARLKAWVTDPANYGVPYDLGFDYERRGSSFCSKFVRHAYEAVGVRLGRTQTLAQLIEEFRGSPERRRELIRFFKLLLVRPELPLARVTITPASQLEDAQLQVTERRFSYR